MAGVQSVAERLGPRREELGVPLGDPDWSAIVVRHERQLTLRLLAMGLRLDEAQDCAQKTWAKLIEKRAAGALEDAQLPGLAFTQAKFFALDVLRTRGRHVELEDSAPTLVDHQRDPEQRMISKAELDRALAVLAECTPSEQRIFRAYYEDPSKPHRVLADELELSVQRVRQVLCQVRAKVRRALEESV